jgi:hypothetical protein
MGKVLFSEEQRFTQMWIWILIIGATLISVIPTIFGIFSQETTGKPWGNNPVETSVLIMILFVELVIMGGIIILLLKMRFKLEIKHDGIWFYYPPFLRKIQQIKKEDIERFEVRKYSPVSEYGGWGIKGSRKNKAYNVSGNTGLQLYLKNGKRILLGTQQSHAIEYAMKRMMNIERLE